MRAAVCLEPFDAAAQRRKRGRACAGHAPLPLVMVVARFLREPTAGSIVHDMF
jgi:hypothetical protein